MRAINPPHRYLRMDYWPLFILIGQLSRLEPIREPLVSPDTIWWIGASLFAVWLFAVGASVGSFLNVVVYRLPAGLNLLSPGSRCPRCLHPIRARHNIPIFGWLMLRGRCADCHEPISSRYPLVELLMGTIFLAICGVELIGNGVNLPRRPESVFGGALDDVSSLHHTLRPALKTTTPWPLGVAATLHASLVATIIAAALIDFDRHPIPSRVATPVIVAAMAASLWWPQIHPLAAIPPAWWAKTDPDLGFDPALTSWVAGLIDAACGGLAGLGAALLFYLAFWYRPWLTDRYAVPFTLLWIAVGLVLGWQMVPWIFALWCVQWWLSVAPGQDLEKIPLRPVQSLAFAVTVTLLGWRWIVGYPRILDGTPLSQSVIYWLMITAPAILLSGVARTLPSHFEFPAPEPQPVTAPPDESPPLSELQNHEPTT
jgi:prepilin signal peptidase PulO-like enzyme (type II secretory pathway)